MGQKVGRSSKRLSFHQVGLRITKATVQKQTKDGWQQIELDRIIHQKTLQEVRLHSPNILHGGHYKIELEFSGQVSSNLEGIYQSLTADKQPIIVTQFESHYARNAFPCIDEPEAKAVFELDLCTKSGLTVLSNTNYHDQEKLGTKTIFRFSPTPKMSTYLLAFVIGDLKSQETTSETGIQVRAWATPDKASQLDFALSTAAKSLDFLSEYFDEPYPLEKCDLVALPDFPVAAMENWGIITYGEKYLLVNDKETSLKSKKFVAIVTAHEVAHQWFGNLVTMKWWDDLWLNEGFASWAETFVADALYPEWRLWEDFISTKKHSAYTNDCLATTHPIAGPIKNPARIASQFDRIAYDKSPVTIHMLEQHLGAEAFRDGLRHYINKHRYANTEAADLWEALEHTSHQEVGKFMKSWVYQAGYPYIKVSYQNDQLSLHQQRFLLDKQEINKKVWPLPLQIPQIEDELFSAETAKYDIDQPLKLNLGEAGFYHTLYDKSHYPALAEAISSKRLAAIDRFGLIDDAQFLNRAGLLPVNELLTLASSYNHEDSPYAWDSLAALASTWHIIMDQPVRDSLKPWLNQLSLEQAQRLGWQKQAQETSFDTMLRPTIWGLQILAEEPTAIKTALKLIEESDLPKNLDADLRTLLYGVAARHGNKATFDKLLTWHAEAKNAEIIDAVAIGLCNTSDSAKTTKLLSLLKTDNVRLQDVRKWVLAFLANPDTRNSIWQWLKEEWGWYTSKMANDLYYANLPALIGRCFSDKQQLDDFENFFSTRKTPSIDRAIDQGIELIRSNIAWRARDEQEIIEWLRHAGYNK